MIFIWMYKMNKFKKKTQKQPKKNKTKQKKQTKQTKNNPLPPPEKKPTFTRTNNGFNKKSTQDIS